MATLIAVLALVLGTAVPSFASSAVPAVAGGPVKTSLEGFSAGDIISDAVFTDKSTMTEAQIQKFFDSKVKSCRGGSDKYGPIVCLKDYRTDSANRPADAYCKGYTGAKNESAARIIHRVSLSCGINPQVLIVMLQKEQSLITHTWPSAWRYDKALGQGCPDDAGCNPKYVGFFQQIYGAARQMQLYMEGKYFTWYAPGKTWNIQYHPNKSCGTAPVHVANKATSALYYYTPYQPNAAAIKAGYGTGDSCSSYGNRNFYNYFTSWFGGTQKATFKMGAVKVTGKAQVGQTLRASAAVSPQPATLGYQWFRDDKAVSGATSAAYPLTNADRGMTVKVSVTAKSTGYSTAVATSAKATVAQVTIDRISGENRIATAVGVSREAWPSGTRTVMLATSKDFPDALSASAAAGRAGGSLLLTFPDSLAPATAAEMKRLGATHVVLIGGEGVLSKKVVAQVRAALPKAKLQRVSGIDRYATSRAAAELNGTSSRLLIATGRDFPDAISAAAAANSIGAPVLLVNGGSARLDAETIATVKKVGAKSISIVGGTGVVPSSMVKQLNSLGLKTVRLSGGNRYETNAAVVKSFFPGTALKVLLASGQDYPDALTGSVLAGRWKVPLMLAMQSCVPPEAADYMKNAGVETTVLIGGPGALDDEVARLRRC
ncbi:cell wall-binding repeat-containing protein [Microbacterium sp. ARD32]|uniref:cell wall-binding repeat-containing protein n=1 Tax=Microbacterium sp. ARD32 TaxID=2962577 RepID=UPI002881779F|nr:cell wall-binding repeat-containing protein [Microbacterium sp. ARD32]MDT0156741.1 cell wall-binding repeat-containing protein [Microbacterium sp. ARD32]